MDGDQSSREETEEANSSRQAPSEDAAGSVTGILDELLRNRAKVSRGLFHRTR